MISEQEFYARLIKQHVPSITKAVEEWAIEGDPEAWDYDGDYIGMVRDCACGVRIVGYYEYVEHLVTVVRNREPQTELAIT